MEIPADARPIGSDTAPELVDAFRAATVTTFQELTETTISLRAPVLLTCEIVKADITALIILKRNTPGRLICAFSQKALESLTRRYLPVGVSLTPEIVDDAAGEFANVIAGQAKTMLKGSPHHYALSTPVVSRVPLPAAEVDSWSEYLLFVFDTDAGSFCLQVPSPCLASNARTESRSLV